MLPITEEIQHDVNNTNVNCEGIKLYEGFEQLSDSVALLVQGEIHSNIQSKQTLSMHATHNLLRELYFCSLSKLYVFAKILSLAESRDFMQVLHKIK